MIARFGSSLQIDLRSLFDILPPIRAAWWAMTLGRTPRGACLRVSNRFSITQLNFVTGPSSLSAKRTRRA